MKWYAEYNIIANGPIGILRVDTSLPNKDISTVEPPNRGHVGGQHKFTSFVLCREVETIGEGNFLRPQVVFLVERSSMLCPFLGGSTIGGFTVLAIISKTGHKQQYRHVWLIGFRWYSSQPAI